MVLTFLGEPVFAWKLDYEEYVVNFLDDLRYPPFSSKSACERKSLRSSNTRNLIY